MSSAFLVNYVTEWRQITKVKVDSIFSRKIICQETIREFLCLYAPRSFMLFAIGEDDDATTCAFSRGCCKVNGTAVKTVRGGLSHSRKYDFLNIVKTNIPLRFLENIIHFYFYYFNCWFIASEKHLKNTVRTLCMS